LTALIASSYRTILRASSIIGGSSVINIFAALAKMKVAAILLGPAGVGLIGMYQSLMQTAGQVAGLGITNSGTRQIAVADAEGGKAAVARTRRALFWGTIAQAVVGAFLFWLASEWIAKRFVDAPERTSEVAWLALGVGLTVAAGAQLALLRGLRRVGDIARIHAGAGVLGAALGVAALWLWGQQGLLALVLVAPAVSFLLGHYYVMRLGRPEDTEDARGSLAKEWSAMASLGLAFMLSGLVMVVGQLAVRVLVQRELGLEALGQFQASWAIGMTYLGFVLGAMGTDFYPRLAAAMTDHAVAVRLVNEQTEVALLLCGPVLVAMLGFAPWLIRILYTGEFAPAVQILRWQLLGDILKVMSWPLGFILVAGGMGKMYVMVQTAGAAALVIGVAVGLSVFGVTTTGMAFLAMYVVYLPLVRWLGGARIGFGWSRAVKVQALVLTCCASLVAIVARSSDLAGGLIGLLLATSLGVGALIRLASVSQATGRLALIADLGKRIREWIRKRA